MMLRPTVLLYEAAKREDLTGKFGIPPEAAYFIQELITHLESFDESGTLDAIFLIDNEVGDLIARAVLDQHESEWHNAFAPNSGVSHQDQLNLWERVESCLPEDWCISFYYLPRRLSHA